MKAAGGFAGLESVGWGRTPAARTPDPAMPHPYHLADEGDVLTPALVFYPD